jgi:hypothetical protein
LASLSQFVSRIGEKAMLLYQLMKKTDHFVWSQRADDAFNDLKRALYIYLSEVLTLSKQNYPHYQKVAYGVYMAAKKLKHYFEEHPITVVSTTPLSEIIGCKDAMGRVAKWAIELATHTIQYKPRMMIKRISSLTVESTSTCRRLRTQHTGA